MTDRPAELDLPVTVLPADGAARGYRADATLSVRTEIRRQWSRRRTRLTLGLVLALPVVLVGAFKLGTQDSETSASFVGLATSNAGNFTVFTLGAAAGFLLTITVALLCGDTIASEASCGSLRYLLAVPVPRARLLGVKLVVSLLTSALVLVVLTVSALVVGGAAFGWGSLRTPTGDDLALSAAAWRIAGMVGYLAVSLFLVAMLAFWLSTTTDAPLAAVGGAVLVVILASILDQVSALGDVRNVLPMHYSDAWRGLFTTPLQLDGMTKGALSSVIYGAVFLSLAFWTFQRKDVMS